MLKKSLRMFAIVTAGIILTTTISGCKSNKAEENAILKTVDGNLWEGAADSSDLPTWDGKEIKLKMWYAQGTGHAYRNKISRKDVVTPEIKRVTGVMYDAETSYDNGGKDSMEVKMGRLAAANDWPDVIVNVSSDESQLKRLNESGLLYDLTPYLKYCPNIMWM